MDIVCSLRDRIEMALKSKYAVDPGEATKQQVFDATAHTIRDHMMPYYMKSVDDHHEKKNLFYMCMEFLLGRTLNNALMNMRIYDDYKVALDEMGYDIEDIICEEPDPGLGIAGAVVVGYV